MIADADGELVVRPMEPRDAEAVTGLIVQLGYDRPLDEVVGWIERLEPDRGVAFVACLDTVGGDEVVGWIEVSLESHLATAPYALIGGLVVKDGLRGLGVGKRLCAEVEAWSRNKGLTVVRVTSRSTREEAHRFYLREGYKQIKTSTVFEKVLS